MDLVSSIRKEGSRGGVDFKWSDVESSTHRENYLGHSLMAPVGRWQKNRDLNWYAKADNTRANDGETEEEKKQRLKAEEIKRIKEAEEDALARALGLPVKDRTSDANATPVGQREIKKAVQEVEEEQTTEGQGRFGGFVGAVGDEQSPALDAVMESGGTPGGLVGTSDRKSRRDDARARRGSGDDDEDRRARHKHRHHHSKRDRPRSSSRDYRHDRSDRYRHRDSDIGRSRSPNRRDDGNRESQSVRETSQKRRDNKDRGHSRERRRREQSPDNRKRERGRESDYSRERRRKDRSPDNRQREREREHGYARGRYYSRERR